MEDALAQISASKSNGELRVYKKERKKKRNWKGRCLGRRGRETEYRYAKDNNNKEKKRKNEEN
jgi:hypothetical protein